MVKKLDDLPEVKPPEVREEGGNSSINGSVKLKKPRRSTATKIATVVQMAGSQPPVPVNIIAEAVNYSTETVNAIIERFGPVFAELRGVPHYRPSKADILAAAQIAALKSGLDPKKLEKASALSCAQIFEIYNKAERLESGKSTENIESFSRVTMIHVAGGPVKGGNPPDSQGNKG